MAIEGLVAAVHTPFGRDGLLCPARVPEQAALLRKNGVRHAFVAGTTGEGLLLTVAERKQLAEAWAAAREGLGFLLHVGHNGPRDAQDLAGHAASLRPDGIAMMAPPFFRPASVELMVDLCLEVAAAAPDVPFYFYHLPSMTASVEMVPFVERMRERLPTFAGIKYTHWDLMELGRLIQEHGDAVEFLSGRDESLLPCLALGVRGAVGSTYNYAAPLYLDLMDAFSAGDLDRARVLQARVAPLVDLLREASEIAVGKAFVGALGVDLGGVRRPLGNLDGAAADDLLRRVRALDVLGRPLG